MKAILITVKFISKAIYIILKYISIYSYAILKTATNIFIYCSTTIFDVIIGLTAPRKVSEQPDNKPPPPDDINHQRQDNKLTTSTDTTPQADGPNSDRYPDTPPLPQPIQALVKQHNLTAIEQAILTRAIKESYDKGKIEGYKLGYKHAETDHQTNPRPKKPPKNNAPQKTPEPKT